VYGTRHQFTDTLHDCERQTLEGLKITIVALDRALAAIEDHDLSLAQAVVADDAVVDRTYVEVNACVVRVLATQAPVAGDLRMVTGLLDAIRSIERIGDQCVNIAKVVPLVGARPRRDPAMLELIARLGSIARSRAVAAKEAFEHKTIDRFESDSCGEFKRLSQELLDRAVELDEGPELREWAMLMVLVARALGRIAENARVIAEQVQFIVSGNRIQLTPMPQAV
jgi:phosphate transport system protein